MKLEKFTLLAKILHCRRQWQITPLFIWLPKINPNHNKILSLSPFDRIGRFGLTLHLPKSPAVVDEQTVPYILDLNLTGIGVITLPSFYRTQADHSLRMSVTHWLTHWLTTFWNWCHNLVEDGMNWWNQISKQCWCWNDVEVELATAYNSWQCWQQLQQLSKMATTIWLLVMELSFLEATHEMMCNYIRDL